MKLEHVAFNVADPIAMAAWYVKHIGLSMASALAHPPYTYFLRDSSGQVMLELYCNPVDEVPNYSLMNPLLLHIAFVSEDPKIDKDRLVAAGAIVVSEDQFEDGSHLVMLRDPWGLALQLCRRSTSLLVNQS